jgi:hypothetical protein
VPLSVRLEFDRIAQRHFSPQVLEDLVEPALSKLLSAAVHRQLALTVTAAHRQMAAAAPADLEGTAWRPAAGT